MTDEGWRRIARIVSEAFDDYEAGLVALRERVVVDLKRKLTDSKVLDYPHLKQPLPRKRPATAASASETPPISWLTFDGPAPPFAG